MRPELERLIEETLSHHLGYKDLIKNNGFKSYVYNIESIYPIRSHQIIAKCAVDYIKFRESS